MKKNLWIIVGVVTLIIVGIAFINIKKEESLFIKGVDISTLIEMETLGQKYYYKDGKEADLFDILSDAGVNWIRVRLWNDPYSVSWSAELSKTGEVIEGPIGAGTNDLATAIALSKRAKKAGMDVLLDFHYSDFWADPAKQYKPDAWVNLHDEELKAAMYEYTYDTLVQMAKEDVLPNMVQIGNEINNGFLWPDGEDITSQAAFELLEQGTIAVREIQKVYDQPIKIMIHLAEGGDRRFFMEAFDSLTKKGLDYDVIGLSFYSYWHGTLKDLQLNLKMLEEKYGKELVVAELAYGNGYENGDITDNIFNEDLAMLGGYEGSVLGQTNYVQDIMETVADVKNSKGLGVFYWEPAWLTPEGAGWISGDGNGWENQGMFSTNGVALDSLDVFKWDGLESTASSEPSMKAWENLNFKIDQGQKVSLPYRIQVLFDDARYKELTVKWENIPLGYNQTPGMYQVKGIIEDLEKEIEATIEVIENHNVLFNGGFEDGDLTNFSINTDIFKLGKEGENPFVGKYALNYWSAADFEGESIYNAQDILDGTYELSVFIMGSSLGDSNSYLFARTSNESFQVKIEVTGYNDWKKLTISQIQVLNGDLEFGIHLNETGGSWGWIDDFQLTPVNN